jgi:hypothetical protein
MEQINKMLESANEDTSKAKSILRTIKSLPQDELKRIIGEDKYEELQGKLKVLEQEIENAENDSENEED